MLKLLAMLGAGLPAIVAALLAFLTRKFGTATATIASFIILTAAFIACINIILQTVLGLIQIPSWIANSVGLFIPVNFTACLSAIMSARICRVAYDMAFDKIKLINSAS